ncbi:phosphate ABC transporter substrate-binding protein PstS [Desulfosporosinus sp. BICA1-9]|uniref:phosphate ABC transporter substrate-binding protein PstS n=1 Tax=Desulfosporosinus sp. BICA1-9 TaxID=1531958 RepID=UPI00054C803C|nr:phosphate ABC transporter substrate-binding protein PstS [Desulfosporosinus sp. BICA1-9]KJS49610.1 MAG: phosphate ABC transporter substrate-binding protein [Peptococcaceae bacterium BRH_c23]KJS77892.1 MAG: phosphate ABC transporter substrate-binding protein [Desulfosporosinus sp. BICA1-9]HBW39201.1 phosphate ABC transporter substrate-binding protein PstS [Desulfosporosinus sp.]
MFRKMGKFLTTVIIGMLAVTLVSCGAQDPSTPAGQEKAAPVNLTGAGSSFVFPLLNQQIEEYRKNNPNITINYQSTGSGAGIKQVSEQTLDFGATDGPMTEDQQKVAKGGKILHIPLTLGAVAVTYNAPNVPKNLKLGPAVLADIFLGKITHWNDQRIASENPGVSLPDTKITVARRSDGSGTTYIFSDYLTSVSPEWSSKVGKGTSLNWPVGIGGKGNAGVAGVIQQTPGTIGYLELAYAVQNNLSYATMQNKEGKWIVPSLQSTSAAAAAATIPEDMRVSIVNAPGVDAYPIAGFAWALIYQDQKDKAKGTALVNFINWAIHDGQNLSEELHYPKLPASLISREEVMLKSVTFQGQPILK